MAKLLDQMRDKLRMRNPPRKPRPTAGPADAPHFTIDLVLPDRSPGDPPCPPPRD